MLGNKHTGFLGLWQLKSGLDKQEIRHNIIKTACLIRKIGQ